MQVGDCFYNKSIEIVYKIVKVFPNDRYSCNVYCNNRFVGILSESKSKLKEMRKLSSLEKELM
jgi:hypothetical protein